MEDFGDMLEDIEMYREKYKQIKKEISHLLYLKSSGKGEVQIDERIEELRKEMLSTLFKIKIIEKEMDGNEDDRYKTDKRK